MQGQAFGTVVKLLGHRYLLSECLGSSLIPFQFQFCQCTPGKHQALGSLPSTVENLD